MTESGEPLKPFISLSGDDDGKHYILYPVSEDKDDWTYERHLLVETGDYLPIGGSCLLIRYEIFFHIITYVLYNSYWVRNHSLTNVRGRISGKALPGSYKENIPSKITQRCFEHSDWLGKPNQSISN